MADIFISYAREDAAKASAVARGLQAQGYSVFWDSDVPPGQSWADYIEGKLAESKVMIVLWSAASTGSQWVREEARIGRDKGKLIPALIDGVAAPFGFGEVQAADLTGWAGGDHPGWRALLAAVAARVGAPQSAPQPAFAASYAPPPGIGDGPDLSPLDYVKKCLRLYFNARGRARRAEYWWWTAFAFGVSVVTTLIDMAVFDAGPEDVQPLSSIASLALLSPGLCVTIRRWHDVGLSGWWVLAAFVLAIVGGALLVAAPAAGLAVVAAVGLGMLAVAVIPSREGPNKYGPNPKTAAADMAETFG